MRKPRRFATEKSKSKSSYEKGKTKISKPEAVYGLPLVGTEGSQECYTQQVVLIPKKGVPGLDRLAVFSRLILQ